ncbi:metallophosphoesterase [Micromonospora auratinigra]|uniref:Calcineurin-like phosphoesterase n=1 Tax=Micromonospora auratinigra TaxID=261654 RepID=A0A1A9A2W8_9ACTN|nr:metallophosphoesterase [Micromonospora auratinigra]SBT50514.1 Calcineurin-like phosphoesterase [Micromonospora auratinigra]
MTVVGTSGRAGGLRLLDPVPQPLASLDHRSARSGGGSRHARLPVDRLRVDRLPAGCDALLVTGDLQGVAVPPTGGDPVLLGLALADQLAVWAEAGLLPPPERIGVLLTGDLYAAPAADRRGASGPVADVWLAFAAAGCPMVFGVAGNHDEVTAAEVGAYGESVALLDGESREWGGLRFAGVGGVVGDPRRPHRRDEADFLRAVGEAAATAPATLLLHEGPTGESAAQRGNPGVRQVLAAGPPTLTLCGHVHWDEPVARLGDGHVLNVDGRAVLLTA